MSKIIELQKAKKALVNEAKSKLEIENIANEDRRKFLNNISSSICPWCKTETELELVEFESSENSKSYKFACGHRYTTIHLEEKITVSDKLKLKARKNNKKPHYIIKQGYEPSGDPKLPKGVNKIMRIDRENHKYDQVVIDRHTGQVIHEEHEPLNQHKGNV